MSSLLHNRGSDSTNNNLLPASQNPAIIGLRNQVTQPVGRSVSFDGEKTYTLDEYGFLDPPDQWNENFADGMARRLGISGGLTLEHWDFIIYLRKQFLEENTVPVIVKACADNSIRLNRLRYLFPTGYHRGACKIAGINYQFMYRTNIWLTYEHASVLKSDYRMTEAGFLMKFEEWNERFAQIIASEWNLPDGYTDKHREIIHFLREFFRSHKNIPTVFETCKAHDVDHEELMKLFPTGYRRGACRMAGLPFFA